MNGQIEVDPWKKKIRLASFVLTLLSLLERLQAQSQVLHCLFRPAQALYLEFLLPLFVVRHKEFLDLIEQIRGHIRHGFYVGMSIEVDHDT
jgi:hypothetical protein